MKQGGVIYIPGQHNQFKESKEKINQDRQKEASSWTKDKKEGQSEYRVEKKTGKKNYFKVVDGGGLPRFGIPKLAMTNEYEVES